jgi:hypothetical protein
VSVAAPAVAPQVIPASRLAGITLASVAAGMHAVLIADRSAIWWGYGAVMAGAALVLAAAAAGLGLRPSPRVVASAIVVTVSSTMLDVVTHTSGLPFGPGPSSEPRFTDPLAHAGHPNYAALTNAIAPLRPLDVGCLVAEVALVVLLVYLLPACVRRRAANLLCAAGVLLWAVAWTGLLS